MVLLRLEVCLPSEVRGPLDLRAFSRLALILSFGCHDGSLGC